MQTGEFCHIEVINMIWGFLMYGKYLQHVHVILGIKGILVFSNLPGFENSKICLI